MATIDLQLPHHRYQIHVEPGLLSNLGELVKAAVPHERAALLADQNVFYEHGLVARQSLASAGYDVVAHPLPLGEDRKNLEAVAGLYRVLVEARMERRSPVVALGGGVVGDTVGFVAATYLRGVPFVQCPTTLLAMVDASVGGKVGVNLPQGKNLVGSFYQPSLVAIDTETLSTLPPRELRCGLAECVKHGMIRDAELFAFIEENVGELLELDPKLMVELVARNVSIKAAVVAADEKEAGQRAHLNFGHTFAHAIEATAGFGVYHHGEAVALGMVAATGLAVRHGRVEPAVLDRLVALLDRIGLPTEAPDLAPAATLIEAMQLDKKVAGGKLRLIVPDRLGAVSIVDDLPKPAIAAAWDALRSGG
jgi:3-dehydroquinate synthase